MKQSKQPGPRRARRPRRPSGGRGRSLLQPLIFLLICAALVLGMSVFFRVAKIEVVGNSIYTAKEVVDAMDGELRGNPLFASVEEMGQVEREARRRADDLINSQK